jgi:hypothetical protein
VIIIPDYTKGAKMENQAQMTATPLDEYLSMREVTRSLRLTGKTMHAWIKKGYVRGCIKVGGTYAFAKDYRISKDAIRMNIDALRERLEG